MNRLLAVALCAVVMPCLSQTPVWTQFPNSPVGSGNYRNDDISFTDLTNGWSARGIDGIYRTTNCGQAWFSTTPHIVTNVAHFRSIGFATPLHGWIGNLGPGSYDSLVTDTNLLYETFDGGNTWTINQTINDSGMAGFCAMHIPDSQTIYGAGRVRGPAYFVKSTNAGTSWYITNLTAAGVMGGLMDVHFVNTNLGFVVGMNTNSFYSPPYFASIARTTNGGLTWQVVANAHVTNSYFWKMSWPTTNVCYVSLQQNNSYTSFVFYKTTDGGNTWTSNGIPLTAIGSPASFELQGVGFVSTNEGWLGGGSLSPPYNMIHTTDGGQTWTAMGYNNANNLNRFRFVSPTLGYLSGIELHVYHVPLAATVSPASASVPVGSNFTFTATAYGTAPMTFQWQLNGTNISGGTTNGFSVTNAQPGNVGSYTLVLSDFTGSVTSSVASLTLSGVPVAPTITSQPQSVVVNTGSNAVFSVTAAGTSPLYYQWHFNGTNLPAATNSSYSISAATTNNVGGYFVVVTNVAGRVTSSVAVLAFGFFDNFDAYITPIIITNNATTNGYKIFFSAASGGYDFTAIFGFDYSTVGFPTIIPPAPHSIGGSTLGLYLTCNKNDANGAVAAVNLYPVGISYTNNYALKFDLWMNWGNLNTTEHALFGLNCSGNVTNRIGQNTSDGVWFAMDGDGGVSATSASIRDYSVFLGGGPGNAPILKTSNFGPTAPLGANFDNADAGFVSLFPFEVLPGFGTTPAGVSGLRWVSVEVRQEGNLITWLLDNVAVAQFTNTTSYTGGNILIGYNDDFASIGDANNFAVIDNVSVEGITYTPPQIVAPLWNSSGFSFEFGTDAYESYTVQWTTNLLSGNWNTYTNFYADGTTNTIAVPLSGNAAQFFRVTRP
ncbi:MAG TPA: immunoglobulin domain-containing protein [Candidatus Sulfotelmatobacter sp.]|nr:immunoglobulin domain-containing protein [Candidatus Sulfotelmatobacter sp.]